MGLRKSGKKALIQLTEALGAPFDISGVDTDGRSRANSFEFSIAGTIAESNGYNQPYTEPVPVGQSAVSGSLVVFYNSAASDVNEYLWELYEAQHDPEDCEDVAEYTLDIFPEGDCEGKEQWSMSNFVIENLDIKMPHDEIMTVELSWKAWIPTRSTVAPGG